MKFRSVSSSTSRCGSPAVYEVHSVSFICITGVGLSPVSDMMLEGLKGGGLLGPPGRAAAR